MIKPSLFHPLRLFPAQDLKHELQRFVQEKNIQAGCIVTCVGSLQRAALRFAGRDNTTIFEQRFEIVSLTGTLGLDGVHLHIALSDENGVTLGGHLMDGNSVYTTAEVVIAELLDVEFRREVDPITGYKELVVRQR